MPLSLSAFLSICLYLCFCLFVSFVYVSVSLSLFAQCCLPLWPLSLSMSLFVCLCLSVCLCLPVCLCLSVSRSLSVCLSASIVLWVRDKKNLYCSLPRDVRQGGLYNSVCLCMSLWLSLCVCFCPCVCLSLHVLCVSCLFPICYLSYLSAVAYY